ncbi:DUF2249 domain-containing protein [Tahibacter amnicola]|uniref:DUF2249 domain-containing protein n=1 Tax=Tahibacter amnicola TaxID=2976241 RepID=A0ABY6BPY3_9GAMM|nr:DUF2249 domain-containing protein [Tahibacter amnicola]UXI70480.1 DUF2249 domain-containing protein [Tahibacter amnicola]
MPLVDGDTLRRLDLRDLAPPEPMVRALDAAMQLRPGESVHVLTPLYPHPLLEALGQLPVSIDVAMLPAGGVCVMIACDGADRD